MLLRSPATAASARIDDIGEAANQFALAKAIASGDTRLMQKAGLEGEIARLDRQRAAHFDDQLAVRRQISNAEFDLQAARQRVEQIGEDLRRRISTRADNFVLLWQERRIEERRTAGALLLSKVRLALREKTKDRGGPRHARWFQAGLQRRGQPGGARSRRILVMRRTGFEQHIETDDDVTPAGLIARIEHILERMPQELQEQARKVEQAGHRLAGYKDRLGQPFALQGELDGKLAQLAALEADLAATAKQEIAKAA